MVQGRHQVAMPPRPLQVLVATLRRCQHGLATAATAVERQQLLATHDEALTQLESSIDHSRAASAALARRVAELERQLQHHSPSQRRAAICERLGLSRSRYYELRNYFLQSERSRTAFCSNELREPTILEKL